MSRERFRGDVVGGEAELHEDQREKPEYTEAEEMSPRPWDLEVGWSRQSRVKRLWVGGAVGERVAGRNFGNWRRIRGAGSRRLREFWSGWGELRVVVRERH